MIEVKRVAKPTKEFLSVPWKIYKDDPHWVPPLLIEQKNMLDVKKNPFFKKAKLQLFIAYKDGKVAGRIAGILNSAHNEYVGEKAVFFGFFESIDDSEVTSSLLNAVSLWGKEHGALLLKGPTSPSINDDSGLLIDGFDSSPYLMMSHNPSFYQKLLEECGMSKSKDLVAYCFDIKKNNPLNHKLPQISERVKKMEKVTVRSIDLSKVKIEELEFAYELYNSGWEKNWGFVPMTLEEFRFKLKSLKEIAHPDFTFLLEVGGKPVGFTLALPNINEILKKMNGRLLPFGWLKLLRGMKRISTIRIFALGVVQEYQAKGLGAVCYHELALRCEKNKIYQGEMSWILEDNYKLTKSLDTMGLQVYKKYRIFEKTL